MNEIQRLQHLAGLPLAEGEGEEQKVAVGHVDNERDMIKKELYQMGKYSIELYKMLDSLPDSDFPHWWQGKVVKASEYLSSAKHYLENELAVPEDDPMLNPQDSEILSPELRKDDPSGVS